jgi:hypothetical protein
MQLESLHDAHLGAKLRMERDPHKASPYDIPFSAGEPARANAVLLPRTLAATLTFA